MEAKDMAGHENLGRGIFPISAPPREASSLPKRRVETTPGFPEQGKPPKTRKKLGTKARIALAGLAVVGGGAGAYETYQNVPAVHRAVDSAFLDHLRGKFFSTEASTKTEVFDNNATKGVRTDKNTIQLTREEYAKIAPPVINRENVQEVPVEFATPGGKRNLTFERGTSVNAMIYIKTADGQIRDVAYEKITNSGKLTGDVFPNCEVFVGKKNEIQAGDIFPAPISGFASYSAVPRDFYKGEELEKGSAKSASYHIEGEYVDEKGKKFRVYTNIYTLGLSGSAITKALTSGIPNSNDFGEKDSTTGGSFINAEKLNKARVKVNQGENLFKFITPPPLQHFSPASPTQSQVVISVSYRGNIGENGIANAFGGENCVNPTLDNKAIVIK